METATKTIITVQAIIKAPVAKVWQYWTLPDHIIQWCNASDDWHTPWAKNDLKTGGKFSTRMEAKDGSFGFEFGGVYDVVEEQEYIAYTLEDGRKVEVAFTVANNATTVVEKFEAENQHAEEMQRTGWQSILDNFKKYTECN
jgi:uncharacterized protein YndB with AHSA1/START domain